MPAPSKKIPAVKLQDLKRKPALWRKPAKAANTREIIFNTTEQNPEDEHSCLDPLPDRATPARVPNNLPAEDTEQPPGPRASM